MSTMVAYLILRHNHVQMFILFWEVKISKTEKLKKV